MVCSVLFHISFPPGNFRGRNITTMLSRNLRLNILKILSRATFEVGDRKMREDCKVCAMRNINSFLRENHKSQNTYHQTQRLLTTALNFTLALLDGNPYNPIMQGSILGSFSPKGLPVLNKHHNYCKCCLFSLTVLNCHKFSKGATRVDP